MFVTVDGEDLASEGFKKGTKWCKVWGQGKENKGICKKFR